MGATARTTLTKPDEGRTIGVVGDVYRFLATGDDTGGQYALWEAVVPPGGGPPPHTHSREQEWFYILDGQITFVVDNKRVVAGAGTFTNMPIGVQHAFKNETDRPARMLISVTPAGLEKMFFEVGQPVPPRAQSAPLPSKEEMERLVGIAARYGITITPPPP
jgi:quercetin dioxygenase-like cupin family protein